jgi:hypothetical protein
MHKTLFEYKQAKNNDLFYSEFTLQDLNIEHVFEKVNHTTTPIGEQFLYCTLCKKKHESDNATEIEKNILKVSEKKFLYTFKKAVKPLKNEKCYNLFQLLNEKDSLKINRLIKSYFFVYPVVLALIFIFKLYLLFIPLLFLNIYCYAHAKSRIFYNNNGLFALSSFCSYNIRLNKLNDQLLKDHSEIPDNLVKKVSTYVKILDVESSIDKSFIINEILSIRYVFTESVKLLLLFDSFAIYKINKILKNDFWLKSYYLLGKLDMALSVKTLREKENNICIPQVNSSDELAIENAINPLVDYCKPISMDVKNAVVTGANMGGKSTLLRTIGINTILAKSLNTCFCNKYRGFLFDSVYTSMNIVDNIEKGESLFKAETNRIWKIYSDIDTTKRNLILIDEPFTGTNRIEGLAISTAFINYLSRNQATISIIVTHEPELANRLNRSFNHLYFEKLNNESESTYSLKEGKKSFFHAIDFVSKYNFPEDLKKEMKKEASELFESINATL